MGTGGAIMQGSPDFGLKTRVSADRFLCQPSKERFRSLTTAYKDKLSNKIQLNLLDSKK